MPAAWSPGAGPKSPPCCPSFRFRCRDRARRDSSGTPLRCRRNLAAGNPRRTPHRMILGPGPGPVASYRSGKSPASDTAASGVGCTAAASLYCCCCCRVGCTAAAAAVGCIAAAAATLADTAGSGAATARAADAGAGTSHPRTRPAVTPEGASTPSPNRPIPRTSPTPIPTCPAPARPEWPRAASRAPPSASSPSPCTPCPSCSPARRPR